MDGYYSTSQASQTFTMSSRIGRKASTKANTKNNSADTFTLRPFLESRLSQESYQVHDAAARLLQRDNTGGSMQDRFSVEV